MLNALKDLSMRFLFIELVLVIFERNKSVYTPKLKELYFRIFLLINKSKS